MIFSEFDSYRESKSLQWMCPCALLGRDLPLRHHRHRLHHEEDGYVLGWSLQVRTGTCPVWVASPLTWIMRRYERWWPRLFNTLYRWLNFWMFQGWRKMYFYNLALILPSHESSSSSAALLSLEKVKVLDTQSCPTLCDPMDCSPPGSSTHGFLHARILEWVAIPFSRGSSWPRDRTWVSCTAGRFFTIWATREVLSFFKFKKQQS